MHKIYKYSYRESSVGTWETLGNNGKTNVDNARDSQTVSLALSSLVSVIGIAKCYSDNVWSTMNGSISELLGCVGVDTGNDISSVVFFIDKFEIIYYNTKI